MKTKLLLLAVSVAAFSSCTTMYKTGQTPDDVYFSPVRTIAAEGDAAQETTPAQPSDNNYYTMEDRAIRMGITDYRYRYLDNDYGYSPYSLSFNYGHNYGYGNYYGYDSYYNPYFSGISFGYYSNYYYNPYYSSYPVYVSHAGPLRNTTPRTVNLAGYNHNYNNVNSTNLLAPHPSGNYNNTNTATHRNSGLGNLLNRVLTPAPATNNTNYNNTNNNTTRTYTPPASTSSSSSSSSSGSSGGGRVSRPN